MKKIVKLQQKKEPGIKAKLIFLLVLVHGFSALQYWILDTMPYTFFVFLIFLGVWCFYFITIMYSIKEYENKILGGIPKVLKHEISLGKELAIALSVIAIGNLGKHLLFRYYYANWDIQLVVTIVRDVNLFLSMTVAWAVEARRHPTRFTKAAFTICKYAILVGGIYLLQVIVVMAILCSVLPIGR